MQNLEALVPLIYSSLNFQTAPSQSDIMSTLDNVDSVANPQQNSFFKPSVAPDGPLTDKGVSLPNIPHPLLLINFWQLTDIPA